MPLRQQFPREWHCQLCIFYILHSFCRFCRSKKGWHMKGDLTFYWRWRHRTMYQHRRRCHLLPPPRSSRPTRQWPMQKMGATKSLERPSDVPSCLAYLFRSHGHTRRRVPGTRPVNQVKAAMTSKPKMPKCRNRHPAGATVRRPAVDCLSDRLGRRQIAMATLLD